MTFSGKALVTPKYDRVSSSRYADPGFMSVLSAARKASVISRTSPSMYEASKMTRPLAASCATTGAVAMTDGANDAAIARAAGVLGVAMNDVFGQVTTTLSSARLKRTMRALGNWTYGKPGVTTDPPSPFSGTAV